MRANLEVQRISVTISSFTIELTVACFMAVILGLAITLVFTLVTTKHCPHCNHILHKDDKSQRWAVVWFCEYCNITWHDPRYR